MKTPVEAPASPRASNEDVSRPVDYDMVVLGSGST